VIGNEAEVQSLYQTEDTDAALAQLSEICPLVVCTRSGDGVSAIQNGNRVDVSVETIVPVDATGAGDQFAAGFLYGILTDRELETACRMGCISAGEVIRHVGPRPEANVFDMFKAEGLV
jgi:sugar/nucleoside kinase (ribokinase family)